MRNSGLPHCPTAKPLSRLAHFQPHFFLTLPTARHTEKRLPRPRERHLACALARDPGVLAAGRLLLEYTNPFVSRTAPSPLPEAPLPEGRSLTWSGRGTRPSALHGRRKGLPTSPTAAQRGSDSRPSYRPPCGTKQKGDTGIGGHRNSPAAARRDSGPEPRARPPLGLAGHVHAPGPGRTNPRARPAPAPRNTPPRPTLCCSGPGLLPPPLSRAAFNRGRRPAWGGRSRSARDLAARGRRRHTGSPRDLAR